jgi:integrase
MAHRRGNGNGSVYRRASDGRWLGVVVLGYDTEGRPIRKATSARTRTEVVQKLKVLQRQVDDSFPPPDTTMTVAQLLTRWRDEVLRHQVAPSTADNYESVAMNHIAPALGRKKVAKLTAAEVDHLLSTKLDEGLSASTVRRIRAVISQALDQGVRWGIVSRNVATLTRGPRIVRREGRTLSPEDARRLLDALHGHRSEALYTLMLSTGLRRGEALGLKWDDLDLESGVLLVRRQLTREGGQLRTSDTKTPRSRRAVDLPAPLVSILRRHRADQAADRLKLGLTRQETGYVFTTSIGTPFDPRNMYREFQSICISAGLGKWHPHELRHSAASLMVAQGVKLQVVSEVLGHSSIRMTADVYGHVLAPDRRAAANAMGETLWGSQT